MAKKQTLGRPTRHQLDKHRALLAEVPEKAPDRQNNVDNRNQMLAATQAYNMKIDRDRMQSHITRMPNSFQRAAVQYYMGYVDRRAHHMAKHGPTLENMWS